MLDIGLTVWAWRRGWRAWALIPIGVTFFIAIMLGTSGALDTEGGLGVFLVFALAEIGTLIYMIARPLKKQTFTARSPNSAVAPVIGEPLSIPVKAEPVTTIEPATVAYPVTRAKLVLPNSSEISLTEATRPMGRNDFDKAVSPEALRYISRQHFLIRSEQGKYFVEDCDSANGTKTNGIDIKGKGRQELKNGDRIDIADVAALTFRTYDWP